MTHSIASSPPDSPRDAPDDRAPAVALQAVLDQLPQAVLATDREWRVRVTNAAARTILERIRTAPAPDVARTDGASRLIDGAVLWDLVPGLAGSDVGAACRTTADDGRPRVAESALPSHRGWFRIHVARETGGWLVLHVHEITTERRLAAELVELTDRDVLTGVANRRHFTERLAGAIARARASGAAGLGLGPAVLLLDLDGFGAVNVAHGHEAGDRLLGAVAARLDGAARAGDLVARVGADEFAVLVEDVAREGEGAIAERLRDVLAAPFVLAGTPASGDAEAAGAALSLQVSACVGAVALDPGRDADAVLRHAALALARARGAGSGRVELFTPALHAEARERDELAAALRAAVEESGDGRLGPAFSLVFQPVVDLTTGDAPSVEALLRWRHPTIGPVSPATFIPLAEELGLVSTLGQQVLGAACAAVARLAEGATAAGLVVAVNVSGHQLQRRDFADDVAAALRASGLPPARLTLEVTETALVRDPRRARRVLGEIRALGVRVAIDDFGTGYSSLAYLQQLPLDVLKIDKRFVDGVGLGRGPALAIPRAIVALGRALGLRTVAEGIETAAQRDALHALGCTSGQGYLFARPLPLAELRAWLAARAEAHGAAPAAPSVV